MIVLPIYLQMVFEYNALQAGLSIAPLSLSMFFVALLAGRRAGRRRPATVIRAGFGLLLIGVLSIIPIVPRADAGWQLALSLIVGGGGLGLLVSQLNNYTLSPIDEEHVSEAAGVNSAGGSFGLSFGLAFAGAIMLATLSLSFTNMANASTVLSPDQKEQVVDGPRGRRPDHEQHASSTRCSPTEPPASRPRSSGSTPRRGTSRSRSRCSFR